MGIYLNPGNSGFEEVRNSRYIDQSGMISLINDTIGTKQKLTCVSRPRRFGKSFAAQMLCAYYDRGCDSSALFEDLEIAANPEYADRYRKHLNKYDVIYLDMTAVIGAVEGKEEIVPFVIRNVTRELVEAYPQMRVSEAFYDTLASAVLVSGTKIVMIIDEWDAPIREAGGEPKVQRMYLEFLRSLFKNSGTTDKIFAAAYMTGILPIKKDGSQSAISDFEEYSVLKPRKFGRYIGFTEAEVRKLCQENGCDFEQMKHWYDGYTFPGVGSVYNPNSVMKAIRNEDFDSYWTQTSAADSLLGYIGLNFDGLSETIAELIGGGGTKVDTYEFTNDLVTFRSRDDVLTLLIHFGYLTYCEETRIARIPNEEIRREFARSIRKVNRDDTIRRVRESDQLIVDTVHGNAQAVAAQIEKIHEEESPLHYNGEQSLRSVVKRAYFSYGDEYVLFEELPAGVGYADVVYLPRKDSMLPALLIELKWNKSAESAIEQIKKKHYPDALKGYGGEMLLVAVSYDKEAPPGERKHSCIIEKASFQ